MSPRQDADANKRSVEHQPSETAMSTAMLRALASLDEREEIRGSDYLAEIFLPEERRNILKDPAARKWLIKNHITTGMYEYMIARTAFFDHIVKGALRENIPQIVFLGAGYDSRPYRFKALIRDTRLFELDIHTTQQKKKQLLHQANIPIPGQLVFVPINFNREKIGNALANMGFMNNRKTLFVWEGVTYYLPPAVIDEVLSSVKDGAPAGSSICFDYACLSAEAMSDDHVKKLRELMRSRYPSEPTRFGIHEGKTESFLLDRGYRTILHLTADEMGKKYLSLRDGSSAGKIPPLFCFVHAEVSGKAD
jgi:methyltransferase (TIGR00027 family)